MKKILGTILNFIAKFFKIDQNKLLFQSGRGRVDCNPYALYRYIKDNNIADYKCMWIVERNCNTDNLAKGEYCYYHTFKSFLAMVTSKYWIRSQSLGGIIKKRKGQVYVQTWHGAGDFKKCELDCMPPEKRPSETVLHARDWDYLVCTDQRNEKVMRSCVNYKKETIVIGNMESDFIVNAKKDQVLSIKKKLNLLENKKKIIMYAPTFRDNDLNKDATELKLPIMRMGELDDYIVLLRMHPLISDKLKDIKLPKNFINVGSYENILDLYLITDILITDYSSIIFPFMILEKTLILYPYDYEEYVSVRSGFYLDYKHDLPGPIVYNEDELINTIKNIKDIRKEYNDKIIKFNKRYNSLNDGTVCKRFMELLKNNKLRSR